VKGHRGAQGVGADELVLLPSLRAQLGPKGGFVLTQKYLNGAAQYARSWPGPVVSLVRMDTSRTSDMDHVEVFAAHCETGLERRPEDPGELIERLRRAKVVLAHLSRIEAPLAKLCREAGVPLVYGTEYTLATEEQIIDVETSNPVLRWRRKLWARRTERLRLESLALAAGVQCSGTPTFEVYRQHNARALLFFDNRVPGLSVVGNDALEAKLASLREARPLRLVFGGRLIPMKGVRHLPDVAASLARRGVDFRFAVFGSGPLEGELRAAIARCGLGDRMEVLGPLDFATEWIPTLKRSADLFVCCHPQGDPSSMYPEVMSCGVPIAGFDNEAFDGIVRHSGSGWLAPMHDAEALADRIAHLDRNRDELVRGARAAAAFAREHAFERTYARRTDHLRECAQVRFP